MIGVREARDGFILVCHVYGEAVQAALLGVSRVSAVAQRMRRFSAWYMIRLSREQWCAAYAMIARAVARRASCRSIGAWRYGPFRGAVVRGGSVAAGLPAGLAACVSLR